MRGPLAYLPGVRVILCRQGDVLIALPLEFVIEIMRPLPVKPVQETPPFVRGLSIVRGAPIPVVDAAGLLGAAEAEAGRWVHLRVGARSVALAIQSVEGFAEVASASTAPLPPLLGDARADVIDAIAALDADLLMVLDAAHVLSEADWRALDGTMAAGA